MTRTVDLVVAGTTTASMAAAIEAARRGMRVLVVHRSRRACLGRRLRRSIRAAGEGLQRQVTVLTGAEIVCVDGIHALEAVVIRRIRTGRLVAINASALLIAAASEAPGVLRADNRLSGVVRAGSLT